MAKLKPEVKARILDLYSQGKSVKEIARELEVSGQRVNGIVVSAKNSNLLPASAASVAVAEVPRRGPGRPRKVSLAPETAMKENPAMLNKIQENPAAFGPRTPVPQPPSEGFSWAHQPASSPQGFQYPGTITRYTVERIVPSDGLLGSHPAPFSVEDLGKLYGEGTYKITKLEPGRPPVEAQQTIGPAYGPPTWPKREREREKEREEKPARPYAPSPLMRRMYEQQAYRPQADEMRTLMDFAQNRAAGNEGAVVEALRQIGSINTQILTQQQAAGSKPTESSGLFKDLIAYQQELMTQERGRAADARKEEERRAEAREGERQKAHEREMERIREEAVIRARDQEAAHKRILDLEEKKLELIRMESKIREEAVQKELAATREKMGEVEQSVQAEIGQERSKLGKEFELRKAAMDKEHELTLKLIEAREQGGAKSEGELLFKTLEKVASEVRAGLTEIKEIKKYDTLAKGAAPTQTIYGNVVSPSIDAIAPTQEVNNGHGDDQVKGPSTMEEMIRAHLGKPFFRQILREWRMQVLAKSRASIFAMMFMEWTRHPDYETRNACINFAGIMRIRDWKAMLEILSSSLDEETLKVFESEDASDFYEEFRVLVVESFDEYCEQLLLARRAAREQVQQVQQIQQESRIAEPATTAGTAPSRVR